MKIKANVLKNMIEKVTLNGVVPTSLLEFEETGLKIKLQQSNILFSKGFLDKKAFTEYEVIEAVGIKNNQMFIALLKRYGNNIIKLVKEKNKLKIISETGSTFYTLCDKDMVDNFIEKELELDKLDGGFELNTDKLMSIKTAGDILKVQTTVVEVKDKKLILTVKTDTGDIITEETDVDYKDCYGKYADFLQKIIAVVGDKVHIALDVDYPIQIKDKEENILVRYIIAPLKEDIEE